MPSPQTQREHADQPHGHVQFPASRSQCLAPPPEKGSDHLHEAFSGSFFGDRVRLWSSSMAVSISHPAHRSRLAPVIYQRVQQLGPIERRPVEEDIHAVVGTLRPVHDGLSMANNQVLHMPSVKEIVVQPGNALLRYSIPMPEDAPIGGRDAEKVAPHARFCLPSSLVGLF